jgi:site-specific DNA-methyltransferase (adenine-specific)
MDADEETKKKIKARFNGWKTPQVKSCFEPIVMVQKRVSETFLKNMMKHKVGLINSNVKIGQNMFPSNVATAQSIDVLIDKYFLLPKPSKEEKGDFNIHKTVKPIELCKYLIKLTTFSKSAIVLDPFVGSGTTAVAAKELGRRFIGIDSNKEYVEIAERRLENVRRNREEISSYKKMQTEIQLFAY